MTQSFIVCDPNLCVGCQICELACAAEKDNTFDITRSRIFNVRVEPSLMMSVTCRLCDPPTCVVSCPRDALSQDAETDIILVDREKCAGCSWCVEACEFGVIIQDRANTTVDICDLCIGRDVPACVEYCPKEALSLSTPLQVGQKTRKEVLGELLQELIEA
jgi:carbon-monoxide dehydrogenase iron sulfur subunit